MDFEHSTLVLLLNGVTNIREFSILENEEVVLLAQACESVNGSLGEIVKDVYVSLENDNVRSKFCAGSVSIR